GKPLLRRRSFHVTRPAVTRPAAMGTRGTPTFTRAAPTMIEAPMKNFQLMSAATSAPHHHDEYQRDHRRQRERGRRQRLGPLDVADTRVLQLANLLHLLPCHCQLKGAGCEFGGAPRFLLGAVRSEERRVGK